MAAYWAVSRDAQMAAWKADATAAKWADMRAVWTAAPMAE